MAMLEPVPAVSRVARGRRTQITSLPQGHADSQFIDSYQGDWTSHEPVANKNLATDLLSVEKVSAVSTPR